MKLKNKLENAKGDWIEYLKPIINDYLDTCEGDKMSQTDVDWLITILRAKIEYSQGLVSSDEYLRIINNIE